MKGNKRSDAKRRRRGAVKLAGAAAAAVPLIAGVPAVAGAAEAGSTVVVKESIDQRIAEELAGGSLLAGDSLTIGLKDVFEDWEELLYTVVVQNGSVANVSVLGGDLLYIGAKQPGTTMVDVIVRRSEESAPLHERFALTVEANPALPAGPEGFDLAAIVRYINANPGKFTRPEDFRGLLQAMEASAPRENAAPVSIGPLQHHIDVTVGRTVVLYMSDFFSDADGDPLVYTYEPSGGSVASIVLQDATLSITGLAVSASPVIFTIAASDGEEGNEPALQQFIVNIVDEGGSGGETDVMPPTVTGVADGLAYNSAVTIAYSDESEATALLNGEPFASGSVVAEAGTHTLVVTDKAGNSTTVRFTLDFEAPVIAIEGMPTAPTRGPVALTATISDAGSGVATVTLPNGAAATPDGSGRVTFEATENGVYTFTAADRAGNTATKTASVEHINRLPEALHENIAIRLHDGQSLEVPLSQYFVDPDGDSFTVKTMDQYTIWYEGAAFAEFVSGNLEAYFSGSLEEPVTMELEFQAVASDELEGDSAPATTTFTIEFMPAGEGPVPPSFFLEAGTSAKLDDLFEGTMDSPLYDGVPAGLAYDIAIGDGEQYFTVDDSTRTLNVSEEASGYFEASLSASTPNGTTVSQQVVVESYPPVGTAAPGGVWFGSIDGDRYFAEVQLRMWEDFGEEQAVFLDPNGIIDYYAIDRVPDGVTILLDDDTPLDEANADHFQAEYLRLEVDAGLPQASFTVAAHDRYGRSVSYLVTVAANASANQAPVISYPNYSEDGLPLVTLYPNTKLELDLRTMFTDPDGDELSFDAAPATSEELALSGEVNGSMLVIAAVSPEQAVYAAWADDGEESSEELRVNIEVAQAGQQGFQYFLQPGDEQSAPLASFFLAEELYGRPLDYSYEIVEGSGVEVEFGQQAVTFTALPEAEGTVVIRIIADNGAGARLAVEVSVMLETA